jgi:hypothetical protein
MGWSDVDELELRRIAKARRDAHDGRTPAEVDGGAGVVFIIVAVFVIFAAALFLGWRFR